MDLVSRFDERPDEFPFYVQLRTNGYHDLPFAGELLYAVVDTGSYFSVLDESRESMLSHLQPSHIVSITFPNHAGTESLVVDHFVYEVDFYIELVGGEQIASQPIEATRAKVIIARNLGSRFVSKTGKKQETSSRTSSGSDPNVHDVPREDVPVHFLIGTDVLGHLEFEYRHLDGETVEFRLRVPPGRRSAAERPSDDRS